MPWGFYKDLHGLTILRVAFFLERSSIPVQKRKHVAFQTEFVIGSANNR